MKNTIQLMLIEDSEDYRKGLLCALDGHPDINVIGQYETAETALQTLQETTGKNLPDIILLDLNLSQMSGLDAVPLIQQQVPDVKIVILTQSDKEADVLSAIRLGASGYLLKSSPIHSLIDGIERVHSGGATLDQALTGFVLKTLSERLPEIAQKVPLSKRETEVLSLIAEGQSQKQIASQLDISTHTVSEYIHNIYSKLEVQNAPAAVAKAYRSGILPAEE